MVAGAALAAGILLPAVAALAQSAGQYLENNPYYGVDRGSAPDNGSDDSTIGGASAYTPPSLSISPTTFTFTSAGQVQNFTVRNSGQMPTTAISATVPSSTFIVTNLCSTLQSGQSCTVQVRPSGSSGASEILTVSAQFGGTAQANLINAPPASLSMAPNTYTWTVGDASPVSFSVRNNGGLGSGTVTVSVNSTNFTLSAPSCPSLSSGQSCTVTVTPKSGLTSAASGTLRASISNGSAATASLSVPAPPTRCVYFDGRGDTEMSDWREHTYYSGNTGYGGGSGASGEECNPRLGSQIGTKSVRSWAECRSWCEGLNAGCCTVTRSAHMSSYLRPGDRVPTQMIAYWNQSCIAYARNFPQAPLDNGRCLLGPERTFIYDDEGACRPARSSGPPSYNIFYTGAKTPGTTRCADGSSITNEFGTADFQCDARLCR
jgi:hypothetical protein